MSDLIVNSDDLEKEMIKLLAKFGDEVNKIMGEEIPIVAQETAAELTKTSPKREKSSGYSKGWSIKLYNTKQGVGATIYNKTHPGLVHLLERGHQKVNGKGRTKAQPHVQPARDKAVTELMKRVTRRLENL